MPLIPEEIIDEIQTRSDIAELIGRYMPLKRAGRHFKALCPFHKERTPSFTVNTDKQIYHCFGCGAGGNVFGFLMQHDRVTFPEAVRQLGDHVGVEIPVHDRGARNGQSERLSAVMEKVCGYFERRMADAQQGRAARAYLSGRGVAEKTQRTFRLGVAPTGWDGLLRATRSTDLTRELLQQAGLTIQGKHGDYDRFRHRLMFPIMDVRGRVLGFGGRSLDRQEPKYLNSPETPLYRKGQHLFGLAQAKDAIIARKTAVIVEGYFDCIVLADAGITHVVSPLGTALTEGQIQLLKRYTQEVILAFDADAAGEMATLRSIDLLVEAGFSVRVAQLPAGVDPDECLRSQGCEPFQRILDESRHVFDALLEAAAHRFALKDSEGRVQAAQFILPTVAKVPNAMLRSEYVRQLAERLSLEESAVLEELRKVQPREAVRNPSPASPKSTGHGPERLLVALLLDDPARWEQVKASVSIDELQDPAMRRIVEVVAESAGKAPVVGAAQIISRLTVEGGASLVTELLEYARTVPTEETVLTDCVARLRAHTRKRQAAQLQAQIQRAQAARQDTRVQELLAVYQRTIKGGT